MRAALKEIHRRQHHPGSAKTALQGVVVEKGLLNRMELFSLCQTFDGGDFGAIGLNREEDARANDSPIQKYGAGAAHAMLAAQVHPGKAEILPEKVSQGFARLHLAFEAHSIDLEGNLHRLRRLHLFLQRSMADSSPRRTRTPVRWLR